MRQLPRPHKRAPLTRHPLGRIATQRIHRCKKPHQSSVRELQVPSPHSQGAAVPRVGTCRFPSTSPPHLPLPEDSGSCRPVASCRLLSGRVSRVCCHTGKPATGLLRASPMHLQQSGGGRRQIRPARHSTGLHMRTSPASALAPSQLQLDSKVSRASFFSPAACAWSTLGTHPGARHSMTITPRLIAEQ